MVTLGGFQPVKSTNIFAGDQTHHSWKSAKCDNLLPVMVRGLSGPNLDKAANATVPLVGVCPVVQPCHQSAAAALKSVQMGQSKGLCHIGNLRIASVSIKGAEVVADFSYLGVAHQLLTLETTCTRNARVCFPGSGSSSNTFWEAPPQPPSRGAWAVA